MNTLDNITKIGNTLNFCDTRNRHNRHFRFTVINTGDAYGKDLCLTNANAPMVEVWDTTEARTTQMVSRYYISTLLGYDFKTGRNAFECGLRLQGNEPAWDLSAEDLTAIHQWLLLIADTLNITGDAA